LTWASSVEALAPLRASTCQSTGTRVIARCVIFDVVDDMKAPIDASRATPTATPTVVARMRPRRWARSPRSQIRAVMQRRLPSRW
jgi:hypothetical protein